jgi:PKD repeat protein
MAFSFFTASSGHNSFLTIEYTPGTDTTPPSSISNLANTTNCSSVNWTWTNPTDSDFNHTYVFWNGTFYANLTNATTYSLWSGLPVSTSYTFSSKTVDITGNMNATWTNQTATTSASCVAAPVASFTLQRPLYRIPGTLQVNDTSTNTPTAWNWSWGDGSWTNGTTQNATHKYTTRGKFSINLLCSNAGGSNTTPTAGTVRIVGYENLWY